MRQAPKEPRAAKNERLAEGVGFEPTEELSPFTRFPSVRTRPDYAIPPGGERLYYG